MPPPEGCPEWLDVQLYKCYKPGKTDHAFYTMEGLNFYPDSPKKFLDNIHRHLGYGSMKQVGTMPSAMLVLCCLPRLQICCIAALMCTTDPLANSPCSHLACCALQAEPGRSRSRSPSSSSAGKQAAGAGIGRRADAAASAPKAQLPRGRAAGRGLPRYVKPAAPLTPMASKAEFEVGPCQRALLLLAA